MDRTLFQVDDTTLRLRRVGRLARRRMRIEGDALRNGTHTDGKLTVTLSGLGASSAGVPDTFDWTSDRPIALVIVRAGVDGDDVSFSVGPVTSGQGIGTLVGDGTGIRYIAFCYDAEPDTAASSIPAFPVVPAAAFRPAPVSTTVVTGDRRVAAAIGRPSVLGRLLRAATDASAPSAA
jgi:hypothetical protein